MNDTDIIFSRMFSIIIPLYNKEKTIVNTLKSVLAQTVEDFEVIIVDDGSTDSSLEQVASLEDNRIKVFSQENAGVSAARNRGISEATSDYIAFLDADDFWMPDYLQTQTCLIKKYSSCDIFAVNYKFCSDSGRESSTILNRLPFNTEDGILSNYFEVGCRSHPPLWTSAVVVRKDALVNIGGFPSGIKSGEDLLTWARLACSYKIAFSTKVCAIYNLGEGYDFANQPPRRQDKGDPVGKALKCLFKEYPSRGLRHYIGHWHKMRSSVAIRYFERGEAFIEAAKSLAYYPRTQIIPFLLMPFIPKILLRKIFLLHR